MRSEEPYHGRVEGFFTPCSDVVSADLIYEVTHVPHSPHALALLEMLQVDSTVVQTAPVSCSVVARGAVARWSPYIISATAFGMYSFLWGIQGVGVWFGPAWCGLISSLLQSSIFLCCPCSLLSLCTSLPMVSLAGFKDLATFTMPPVQVFGQQQDLSVQLSLNGLYIIGLPQL